MSTTINWTPIKESKEVLDLLFDTLEGMLVSKDQEGKLDVVGSLVDSGKSNLLEAIKGAPEGVKDDIKNDKGLLALYFSFRLARLAMIKGELQKTNVKT